MISSKQKKILAFPYSKYNTLICDGAVRSGKTSIMMWGFVKWAMERFNGQKFGICGKTVDSCCKNIIIPFLAMSYARELYTMKWRRADKILEISRGDKTNYFEVFGGKDESSFALIQGRTLAGIFLDEVVLMPESFVNQALARCSVEGAKFWFNCNPGSPAHWFYTKWIQQRKDKNILYLRFTMRDNPSLSEDTLKRYETIYTGVFYQRYIQGLWVLAEGLIYPMFDNVCPTIDRKYTRYELSMDYGIQNPTAILLWGLCEDTWYLVKEYYYSGREENSQKTDQQYYDELERLCGDILPRELIIDPSATSFIALCRQKKKYKVRQANNDVLDGIQATSQALVEKKIMINDCCKRTLEEFKLYSWKPDGDDVPIKENDHAMDAIRYFVMTTGITRIKNNYVSIMGLNR